MYGEAIIGWKESLTIMVRGQWSWRSPGELPERVQVVLRDSIRDFSETSQELLTKPRILFCDDNGTCEKYNAYLKMIAYEEQQFP